MMKRMDYSVSGTATSPIIEPLSESAKARTPRPLKFEDRAAALDFMLKSQIEGFRFSGAHLIDAAQKQVKNGYFLKGGGGQLVQIGSDWGPRVPVWRIGDVLPLRDDNGAQIGEAEVEAILDDEQTVPKKFGCTIAFVVKERERS